MALIKGQNAYATLEEANAYFQDKLDVAAWIEASDIQKEQALVTATQQLDNLAWNGTVVDPQQSLAFPRTGTYFDRKLGLVKEMNPVPQRVVIACYELAYHLLNNDGLLDSTGSVKSLTVGPISIQNIVSSSKIPSVARAYIKDMLSNAGNGGNMWWRAN